MKALVSNVSVSARWFWRGFKRGDWLWLWLAVVIASASVTLVEQLAQTVHKSMLTKAAESLSADLVLRSTRPIEASWRQQAEQQGLQTSYQISFTTMAMHSNEQEDSFQMVLLKGIEPNYPLRGQLLTEQGLDFNQLDTSQVLADPQLMGLLNLQAGQRLALGNGEFTVADWLSGQDVFQATFSQFAPQVIMSLDQVQQLGLIGPGSRVNYELGLAGDLRSIAAFQQTLEQQNTAHWQIQSARAPTDDLERAMDTAWLFLDLSALATVLIAGLAILIASRFYLQRWTASMALMRASGASNRQLSGLFALQLTYLALLGSVLGVLVGQGLFYLARPLLAEYFVPLVIPGYGSAIALGLFSGTLALWTFAWPAFRQATQVSPLRVLRQAENKTNFLVLVGVSLLLLITLMGLLLSNRLLVWAIPALFISAAVLYGLARLLLIGLQQLQPRTQGWLRLALAGLARSPGLVTLQLISLGLVIFILVLMTFVRQDLLQSWQASLPQEAPNTFVMNIQPDQQPDFERLMTDYQLEADLIPMVRGRLVEVNQHAIRPQDQTENRARRLLEREANIALLDAPPSYNLITAKLDPNLRQAAIPSVSVEAEIATLFGLQLGDILTFDLIGQKFDYQITGFREVDWQSFRLNFFFVLEPQAERQLPVTYITNFRSSLSPEDTSQLRRQLNQQLAGVLWVDAREMIAQIQLIMQQASMAVSILYLFTLVSSLIVIFTATRASQLGRLRSWLLLRTLGAQQGDIVKIGLTEFVLIGLLAGVFAASLGQIASLLIGYFWLGVSPQLNPTLWLVSISASVMLLLAIGWLTQRHPLRQTPKQLLQQLQTDS
ncbi:ABC transporter permease [Thiomicrospira microaerophila]|uniref:ABC transporter permease n=1 Tax=Thiomicrospira microaerophila TaxID=406020 RepID=UPI00200BE2FC|nr:FtsX-like permease family protein [Thiomicrospira microaerophila]UQB42880.1 ABC transporter permease [Thiomicrospira microaerophila]